ncbi:MAG: hypothetical protein AAFS10_07735, partial [Myxococcota bacterium]
TCRLTQATCTDDDPDCTAPNGVLPNPSTPPLACNSDLESTLSVEVGAVRWFARRYDSDYDTLDSYAGGCINEYIEFRQLCPGYQAERPSDTLGTGNANNFGLLLCGCGENYGGPECNLGCPDAQVHYGGPYTEACGATSGYCLFASDEETGEPLGRRGYWMCADVSSSAFTQPNPDHGPAFVGDGYLLRGRVPAGGTDGRQLCEQEDCTSGFSLSSARMTP